jgi:hypothetical protein
MVGRATPTAAGEGDPIRMGQWNYARGTHTQLQTKSSGSAFRVIQLSGSFALRGDAESGRGVMGVAGSQGTGVWGYSPDHRGVFGRSDEGVAVYAESSGGTGAYAFGRVAVLANGRDVGIDARGGDLAAIFRDPVRFTSFLEIESVLEPETPNPDRTRMFTRVNGSSKIEVCVKFPSGAVQVIATEP